MKFFSRLKLTDTVLLAYCGVMIAMVLIFGRHLDSMPTIVFTYAACMLFSIICIVLRRISGRTIAFFTTLYPLIVLAPLYKIAGEQIHLFFNGFCDKYILALENAIFPVHPTIWLGQFNSLVVTEILMFAYSAYILLLPITAGWLYLSGKVKESEDMVSGLIFVFLASYIMYSLIPVEGPRFAMAASYKSPIYGGVFRALTLRLEATAMLHGGAFPSAHCAAATVMLILSYRYDRVLFAWSSPVLLLLYVSTVYGRYHYPSDVLAGIIVGLTAVLIVSFARRRWVRKPELETVEYDEQTQPRRFARTVR